MACVLCASGCGGGSGRGRHAASREKISFPASLLPHLCVFVRARVSARQSGGGGGSSVLTQEDPKPEKSSASALRYPTHGTEEHHLEEGHASGASVRGGLLERQGSAGQGPALPPAFRRGRERESPANPRTANAPARARQPTTLTRPRTQTGRRRVGLEDGHARASAPGGRGGGVKDAEAASGGRRRGGRGVAPSRVRVVSAHGADTHKSTVKPHTSVVVLDARARVFQNRATTTTTRLAR